MGVRENKVEKYLDEQVTALGGITRKWVSPGRDGVPDRIVVIDGAVVFVEVKTVSGELTTGQEREHVRLRNAGATVTTVYGSRGVDKYILDRFNWRMEAEYR
jgi:Holliday junction resolvase-like predicted endonuclease